MNSILVTGAAGFIGFHCCRRLLQAGTAVVGLDNLNSYYSVQLKRDRLRELAAYADFQFVELDMADETGLQQLFTSHRFARVLHLAAQAGVRYSLDNPQAYIQSNLVGFANLLECCRHAASEHLVYASSSSVYGANRKIPFSTDDNVDHPVSLYAATKKSNELMAHAYTHLFGLPTTGLRFFTVYGPWGRPDMAVYKFTESILAGRPIPVFNHGRMQRDLTYVDDVVECVVRILNAPPPGPHTDEAESSRGTPAESAPGYRIYNIGNHQPVELEALIEALESSLGQKAIREYLPMQPGDVPATYADVAQLMRDFDFRPDTPLQDGIDRFVSWYRGYSKVPE